jgi:dTMP kinase
MTPGFLIAIEGIDGAGKTTQAHFVEAALQQRKLDVLRRKEPTTAHWGQIVRDSALTGRLSLEEETEVFIKDRKEHVETIIAPALAEGQIVILDRYYFSNMAYQGARGHDPEDIRRRNEEFAPEPDLLVVLDIDPKISLQRIKTRGDRANHFEKTDSLKKAREIFRSVKKPYLYILDATKPPEELRDLIVRQFTCICANRISASSASLREKFDAALRLLGADPVPPGQDAPPSN